MDANMTAKHYRCPACNWNVYYHTTEPDGCPACQGQLGLSLGNHIAAIIDRCGGKFVKRLFGKSCGCDKRQAWLNRVGTRLMQWWKHA